MSRRAIAAALALREISPAERLVAFSLASFANRDQLAWPSNPVAIGRASLSRSQYLHARDRLTDGGLISIAERGGGRGRSTTIKLDFALAGPWWDGPVNPQLFEAVLSRSSARGPARQLLAAIAAMADADQQLSGVTTDELRLAAGLADSTYRRARAALVSSGGVVLQGAGGGRGRTNRWHISRPSVTESAATAPRPRRVAPAPGSRPLLFTVSASAASKDALSRSAGGAADSRIGRLSSRDRAVPTHASHRANSDGPRPTGASHEMGAQTRTVSSSKGPDVSGVSLKKGAQTRTVSVLNGPDVSGVSLENPAQNGHGRPAYDPKVMALLFYACAQGVRSSREIERKCREDVAFMVITVMRVLDHSTIAEFRKRHERALAGLFGDVLGMCEKAGLVKVGVIAIDGTKISANASMGANRSYERIARELLDELEETDRREDELHGDARGDETPEQLCTPEGRRAALREAKRKLDAERESDGGDGEDPSASRRSQAWQTTRPGSPALMSALSPKRWRGPRPFERRSDRARATRFPRDAGRSFNRARFAFAARKEASMIRSTSSAMEAFADEQPLLLLLVRHRSEG